MQFRNYRVRRLDIKKAYTVSRLTSVLTQSLVSGTDWADTGTT
jgi:hypothetical protein